MLGIHVSFELSTFGEISGTFDMNPSQEAYISVVGV